MDTAAAPMLPEWQCHKRVRAAQIVAIDEAQHITGLRLTLRTPTGEIRIYVDAQWAARHDAKVGGYYVIYADGYSSFSPRAAFEEGYAQIAAPPATPYIAFIHPDGPVAQDAGLILPPTSEPLQ